MATLGLFSARPRATRKKERPLPSLAMGILSGVLFVVAIPCEPRASAQVLVAPPRCVDHAGQDPAGLSILRPYERGKIPVVLVHGLCGSERQWDRMVRDLEADEAIRGRYQFETARILAEHGRMSGKDSSCLALDVSGRRGETWNLGRSGGDTTAPEGRP